MTWVAVMCAALGGGDPQDAALTETRFHRVHLVNGNFVDGHLLKSTSAGVLLRVKDGEMTVRNDMIARDGKGQYQIEIVKLRSVSDKPALLARPMWETPLNAATFEPKPLWETPLGESALRVGPPSRREAVQNGAPKVARTVPPSVTVEVAREIDRILEAFQKTPKDQVQPLMKEFLPYNEEGMIYLAANLESLDDATLQFAGTVLSFMRRARSVPVLIERLQSSRPEVRAQAAKALGGVADPSSWRALVRLCLDPAPEVRLLALTALVPIAERDAIRPVSDLCLDPDPAVRQKASWAVLDIGRRQSAVPEALQAMGDVLRRAKDPLKPEMITALGKTGEPDAVNYVTGYLLDREPAVRAATVLALATLGGNPAQEAIFQRLDAETDLWAKVQLATGARKLRIRKAIGPLIGWLSDREAYLRDVARDTLRDLSGQDFGTDQDKWSAWWKEAQYR
jgi:HEAT repeat protein